MKNLAMKALAVAIGSIVLMGCDQQSPNFTEFDDKDLTTIDSNVRVALNQEQEELKKALADLQAKDPSVKDVFYTVNEAGEKVLTVVREAADGTMESSVFPFVAGMLLGNMIGNMNAAGGYSSYHARHKPYNYRYPSSDYRKRKNAAIASYTTYTRTTVTRAYKSTPSYQSRLSARSSAVFSSSGSSRSTGYSSGS